MGENAPSLPEDDDRVLREAAEWFVLRQAGLTAEAEQSFRNWLDADGRHSAAFAEVGGAWATATTTKPGRPRQVSRRSLIGKAALGVGGLAIVGAAGWAVAPAHPFADYRTQRGERRSAVFPDGSRVELSTDTALSLSFDARQRRVLLHAGSAHFEVVPDADRPFVVEAAGGTTEARGTAFAVSYAADDIEVTVTEHEVSVSCDGDQASAIEGQQVRYRRQSGITGAKAVDIRTALAWRAGRLVFIAAPLRQVVAEIDRWRPGKLILMDDAIASVPISVAFDTQRSNEMVAGLARVLPLQVVTLTPYLTLIYRASADRR